MDELDAECSSTWRKKVEKGGTSPAMMKDTKMTIRSSQRVEGEKLTGVTTDTSRWPVGTISLRTFSAPTSFTKWDFGSTLWELDVSWRLLPALDIFGGWGVCCKG